MSPVGSAADQLSPPDHAHAAYDLESGRFVRHSRVGSGKVDGVVDTDRLEFAPGDFGAPFEDCIFIVQDGDNAPENQNFKMVTGGSLKRLLAPK